LVKILEDRAVDGSEDVLIHGLKKHLEGWLSAACVRGIALEARETWRLSEKNGKYLPGEIPESDCSEIERLLLWIITGQDNRLGTASSDVYCLAEVLTGIGLGAQSKTSTNHDAECDESQMLLVLDRSHIPVEDFTAAAIGKLKLRRSMRILLNSLQECVSLWGGNTSRSNLRRDIFVCGIKSGLGVKLTIARRNQTVYALDDELVDVYYLVQEETDAELPRMETWAYRMLDTFFLAATPETAAGIEQMFRRWPKEVTNRIGWWLMDFHRKADLDETLKGLDADSTLLLGDLVFLSLVITTKFSSR
jgi:hypothetical protein